ncbi:MAG: dienelactone hydrolase family protein, partial [Verrucomicrobiota bacterium]
MGEGQKVPGIVLIHGGGGTAFSDWVWLWAKRGYAAIAMDLSGRRPPAPAFDENEGKLRDTHHSRDDRVRLEKGGLDHTPEEKFNSIGGVRDDDWPFHAVANVMKAHTLLRSFPEVDPDKTAVTGISWGGYTTCLAASIDDRFKAAVPVYGCGFLHEGESVQKKSIDSLGDRLEDWVAAYDPSSHLGKCTVPTFEPVAETIDRLLLHRLAFVKKSTPVNRNGGFEAVIDRGGEAGSISTATDPGN